MTFDTDLRRRRPAVLLRASLGVPPLLVLSLWSCLAAPAVVLGWIAAVFGGAVPRPLHRFLRAYLSYATEVSAWVNLVCRAYPRLRPWRAHPVRVDVLRAPQPRLSSFLRAVLALPGLLLGSVLGVVLAASAVAAWFVGVALGRTTEGLRELGAFCLRYQVEVLAFVFLLSACAPKLEPPESDYDGSQPSR